MWRKRVASLMGWRGCLGGPMSVGGGSGSSGAGETGRRLGGEVGGDGGGGPEGRRLGDLAGGGRVPRRQPVRGRFDLRTIRLFRSSAASL